MSDAATYWFAPAPSEVSSSRLSLDFDLRAADLFFRELVVPELGRIWFARQLSWPVAALALHRELASHGSNALTQRKRLSTDEARDERRRKELLEAAPSFRPPPLT